MSPDESLIERKIVPSTMVVGSRKTFKGRDEIRPALVELAGSIPADARAGPPICVFQYITDVEGAYDVDVLFPVSRPLDVPGLFYRVEPELEVLARVHQGPREGLRDVYRELYGAAAAHAIISDEFGREVYPDWEAPGASTVEIQFVVHRWDELLARQLERVMGAETARELLANRPSPGFAATADERFAWVKRVVGMLESRADDDRIHEILTPCAHVFPERHIERLRTVYTEAMEQTNDRSRAVDVILAYRATNRPWGESSKREGSVVITTKRPRDPDAYEKAVTPEERGRAYCFCPIIRDRLGEGMPAKFCYCGAGWERRQWAGTIGEPVRVRVLHSVLCGDDVCSFATEIPEA